MDFQFFNNHLVTLLSFVRGFAEETAQLVIYIRMRLHLQITTLQL